MRARGPDWKPVSGLGGLGPARRRETYGCWVQLDQPQQSPWKQCGAVQSREETSYGRPGGFVDENLKGNCAKNETGSIIPVLLASLRLAAHKDDYYSAGSSIRVGDLVIAAGNLY